MKISTGTLFIIFLVLKLTSTVTWSWWLVTAPLWVPLSLWFVLVVPLLLFAAAATAISGMRD